MSRSIQLLFFHKLDCLTVSGKYFFLSWNETTKIVLSDVLANAEFLMSSSLNSSQLSAVLPNFKKKELIFLQSTIDIEFHVLK